jgi:outer membrane receptor for ferrienterochelin and colicins
MKTSRAVAALLFPLAMLIQVPVGAAPQSAPAAAESSNRTYLPAEFEQFAPRTALDMLERVPGFAIRQEDSDRGLGTASGNVLVNGQRISGKSNDVITALGRIPAKDVVRIEIVDGATLGVAGLSGQAANVITRSTGISGQWGYYPEFRQYYTDPRLARFDISASGAAGRSEYTIGLDNRASRSGAGGPTWIFAPDESLIEERHDEWRGNSDRPRISGKLAWKGAGGAIANMNASYVRMLYDYLENGSRTQSAAGDRNRRVTTDQDGHSYEIGGDYEFSAGPGRLKLIGVSTTSDLPSVTEVVTSYANGSPATGNRFSQSGDETENIARAEYRWKRGTTDWQISGEGAFNKLDNTSRLFTLAANGAFEEVPLPGATARVTEERYEVMGSWGRPLSSAVTLKLSAGGEYSKLSAGGAAGARTFYRPKGELSAAWKVSKVTDLNVKLARRVGQLNFYDFLASVDLRDDVATAANPDLVPQQSWELDIEGVHNLGPRGSTTLRLYGRLIDDIIDYVPIGASGQAPGNLDEATVYGVESITTLNLDAFGWKGARVDGSLQLEESEVTDPLTGESRPISNNLMRAAGVSLRHDVPRTNFAWGTGASYSYYAKDYRLTEQGRFWEGPVWGEVFLEHKNIFGLTVRGGVYNLLGADSMWDRTVYTGRRTDPVAFVEHRDRVIGPIYSFSVRGKF